MTRKSPLLILFCLLATCSLYAQQQLAILTGVVNDEAGKPLEMVLVAVTGTSAGTHTDPAGSYRLEVPAEQSLELVFSYLNSNRVFRTIRLKAGEHAVVNAVIRQKYMELEEATIRDESRRGEAGAIYLDPAQSQYMANPVGGIEGMVKMFTGYNNELTSQYTVRGGNYDENLVYVNDFEIYRPFLTRSGQQEGLSFVNTDLVSGASFSMGGFQAKYGDKMSSVLDVTYRKPKQFAGSVTASLLGASLHLEGASHNQKLTWLVGLRQKSNQYFLQSQPTKGVYNPAFTDFQALVHYRFNDHWEMEIIGNYARNRFTFLPEEQTASFGVVNQAYQLRMFYTGGEMDQFDSRFAGWSTTWRPNKRLKLKLLASGFQTDERETYDINGEYLLGELETDMAKENFGQVKTYLGTGIIHNFARNYLKVNVGNLAHRGSYSLDTRHFLQWGLDANLVDISDKLHEWERRDSAGYTQPYYDDKLEMTHLYSSTSDFNYMRYSGFLQDNFRFSDSLDLTVTAGIRFTHSTLNGETVFSPRVQVAYKPRWQSDVVFKLAGGMYAQPPFYREMRDLDGNVNKSLRMQKSVHYVAGTDHNFKWGRRPAKVTTEIYYKSLSDLVPYEYDNVRIRYFGRNNAVGYTYGAEVRLYGDLVKDAPSWLSVGWMKSMEDVTDDQVVLKDANGGDSLSYPGYIPRPTDQRLMFGMYFQDYLPRNKNFRMHLNLMYATGLPFGPPDKQRYGDTLRLPDYRRVDIGFSALLLDGARKERPSHSFFREIQSVWASLEVFNLLGIGNTLSYTWIQDQTSGKTYAVPNRLTSRLLNVKLIVKF